MSMRYKTCEEVPFAFTYICCTRIVVYASVYVSVVSHVNQCKTDNYVFYPFP